MVWNEPGKDKDPWNNTEKEPELERLVKNLQKRFGGLFGGKSGGPLHLRAATLWWLIPVIIATWLISGFYRVGAGERGVHFFLGRYTEMVQPGIHWHAPWPVGHADLITGVGGRDYSRSYNRLLTSDGDIVSVDAVAQYHVTDISKYLFNAAASSAASDTADTGARTLLGALVDTSIRAAVSHSTLENLLGSGQDAVEAQASQRLNQLLKTYDAGIAVTRFSFQHVSLPGGVSKGDTGINKAQQQAAKAKSVAQTAANNSLARVKSQADDRIAQARLYSTRLVNQARADVTGFDAVLAAYRKAPAVTREMLYTQTMQDILGNARKVVVDSRNGNVTVQFSAPSQPAESGTGNSKPAAKTPSMSAATGSPPGATHKRSP